MFKTTVHSAEYYKFANAVLNIHEKSTEIPQLRQALNNEMNLRRGAEARIQELLKQIEQDTEKINRLECAQINLMRK